jgi:hypothetical protein
MLGLVSSSWALDRVLVNWLPMWPAITCGNGGCVWKMQGPAFESSLVANKTILETESEQGASRNRDDAENEKNG